MEISSEFENEKLVSPSADVIVLYTSKNTIIKKIRTFGKWQITKEISPEFVFDAKHRQSLNQEFEIGYLLDHPNIVRYIDKKEDENGVPYLVMEYIDGFTLREQIDGKMTVSQQEFDSTFSSILSALAYLHRKQIYHLDIKPENIIVTNKEHIAKLIDFGFAITGSDERTLGTSRKYVAPEFSERTDDITGKTDMYAFAQTMQEYAEAKSLSLSRRQRQIIKSASKESAALRITADEALSLLQKPQRKNWVIVILLVTLTVVGFLLVMLRKEQGPESPQNTHDTIVAEKQQNTAITDLASEIVTPIEQNVSPNKKHTREAKEVSTIKQSSSVVSDTNMTKKETKIHYNDEDSLFVMQEYARCKDCVDALKQEYERKMDELKEKQLEGKNVLFEFKWELEKFKNASLDCSNTMNRTIKEHLQHYADSGDKETYNYYSYELIKKMKTNTVSY